MEPRSLRVPGAGGVHLHLLEWSREGVPFLMLHGFAHHAHVWDQLAPHVAPYYRTVALDLRGHGDSDPAPGGRYSYDDYVADVEAVCDALGFERLVLLGHSLGGRIAMLFAARNPARMAGLVLVDSGPEHDPRGSLRIRLDVRRGSEDGAEFPSVEAYRQTLARAYPAASPRTLESLARHALRQGPDGRFIPKLDPELRRQVAGGERPERVPTRGEAERLWKALREIPCPTLVVRGAASDVLAPETAERMVESELRDARLVLVPRAGHSVMIDNPEGFREAVCDFVLGDA